MKYFHHQVSKVKNEKIAKALINNLCTDVLKSDASGSHVKNICKPLLRDEATFVIRIGFYGDEFEICNPLGSKKGKHKMYGFYYTINNLGCIGRKGNVYLHSLAYSKDVKSYGLNKILQPFIDEMEILEIGQTLYLHGKNIKLIFRLIYVTGDSMGLYEIFYLGKPDQTLVYQLYKH